MDQTLCMNQSPQADDGTPRQSKTKRYKIWLWRGGHHAVVFEAENEEQVESWFFDFYQRHDQHSSAHVMLHIDDLGVVRSDQPVQDLPEAEFLARVRELVAASLTWAEKCQWEAEQHETASDHALLNGTPSQPRFRYYRIWYWSAELESLECDAENEKKAAEWFIEWRRTHDSEITTHSLDGIEEVNTDAVKMLTHAEECKSVGREPGEDFFAALRRLKEKAKQQV